MSPYLTWSCDKYIYDLVSYFINYTVHKCALSTILKFNVDNVEAVDLTGQSYATVSQSIM